MPEARTVGRIRPRSAAEDWFAVGFDPWSAGREPLSAEFIPTLSIKQVRARPASAQTGSTRRRLEGWGGRKGDGEGSVWGNEGRLTQRPSRDGGSEWE